MSVKNNENGIGCTFFISLPIQKSKQSDSPIKPTSFENFVVPLENSFNPLKNTEILVVEDNDDSREVLEFFLNQMGAKVHSVGSSKEGFSYLNSTESLPNIIISDISMPEEDGIVFIGKVRNLPDDKGGLIPAIALTAFVSSNDKKRIMESGFQKHHSKPFEPDLLVNDILEVIRA